MKRCEIRTATEEDLRKFYNHLPPYATKAWVVEYDGMLASIAGVTYTPSTTICFSDIMPDVDAPDITVWRCTMKIWKLIKKLNKPLTAICTGEFLNSGPYLKRLGFEHVATIQDQEVYQWPAQK